MDNKVVIVKSQANDILELKDRLRKEDIQECEANNHSPVIALTVGFVHSDCYSAKVNGRTEAMFGVSSYGQPQGEGVIWFLGSDEVFRHPKSMVKTGRDIINGWFNKYYLLYNAVDARNIRHIAWLKHLGFTFTDKSLYKNGYAFKYFYKVKE